jgi:hypothetical protein
MFPDGVNIYVAPVLKNVYKPGIMYSLKYKLIHKTNYSFITILTLFQLQSQRQFFLIFLLIQSLFKLQCKKFIH